jgi:hypothetical protein
MNFMFGFRVWVRHGILGMWTGLKVVLEMLLLMLVA